MCGICRSKLKRGGCLSSQASTSGTWVLESRPEAHILHFLFTGSVALSSSCSVSVLQLYDL